MTLIKQYHTITKKATSNFQHIQKKHTDAVCTAIENAGQNLGSDAGKDFSTFIDVFLMDMIKYSQVFVADRFIEVSALSNAKKSSKNRSILWST